ncbi:acyltransferase [Chromobacterium violaceum]|uniref:acyltransferase n=1 Tax=Chromobacterium violaceum TaxID=536 RepID=UPI0009DA071E|nr:acyltransferase [Chromobacterium violaceum]MBP4050849.1 acyltransferase [Chromobacterium violaceum]OQS22119.1 transferase [Chromobacterium violaceum]
MNISNIYLGKNVFVHQSSAINNVDIGDGVKIAKRCSIFGSENNILKIGSASYIGMNAILNGYAAQLEIGNHCSIAQSVNIMTDSGPNASDVMQRIFPIITGPVVIGNHCWIGANAVIMPNVKLGDYCIVAANAFVNKSFGAYSIIGGVPARLIRKLTQSEIDELHR